MHNIDFVVSRDIEVETIDGDRIIAPFATRGVAIAFQDVDDYTEPLVFAKIASIGEGIYRLPRSAISYYVPD